MLLSSKERELDRIHVRIMRIVLIVALCVSRVLGQQQNSTGVLEVKVKDLLAAFEQRYAQQMKCFKRLDTVLTSKWSQEYEKINTTHTYSRGGTYSGLSTSKNGYDNAWQEWVMEQNSTSRAIDSCFRNLMPEILPMLNKEDIDCLNTAFVSHVGAENVHEKKFKEYLEKQSKEQPIFRRFVNVNEFFEIMWQNRSLISLNETERKLWEDAYSFVTTDEEKVDPKFTVTQDCEWKNARALREAPNEDAVYEEFVRQVQDLVDQRLGNQVVLNWNLKSNLSENKLMTWRKNREKITLRINEEVAKLRSEKRDAQWLCEYAANLAYELSKKDARILVKPGGRYLDHVSVEGVTERAQIQMQIFRRHNDSRLLQVENAFYKYGNGTLCLQAFQQLIRNHFRSDVACLILNGKKNFQELYCSRPVTNMGLIIPKFCRCFGTFCAARDLASVSAKEYALEKEPDGIYRVVSSSPKIKAGARK